MPEPRKIPYGVINWATLVRECHFVYNTVARAYRTALARRPGWNHPIAATIVEVCGNVGSNWFDLDVATANS